MRMHVTRTIHRQARGLSRRTPPPELSLMLWVSSCRSEVLETDVSGGGAITQTHASFLSKIPLYPVKGTLWVFGDVLPESRQECSGS